MGERDGGRLERLTGTGLLDSAVAAGVGVRCVVMRVRMVMC